MKFAGRSSRISLLTALGGWLAVVVLACSQNTERPPELGDCVKVGDASCPTPVSGSGGGSGPTGGDSGASDVFTTSDTSTACGTAQDYFTTNTSCAPCIEGVSGAGCCGADLACSGQTACLALLQCMLACPSTNVTCADTCETDNPSGVAAYNDFASCLLQNCSPQCPTLPTGGANDL